MEGKTEYNWVIKTSAESNEVTLVEKYYLRTKGEKPNSVNTEKKKKSLERNTQIKQSNQYVNLHFFLKSSFLTPNALVMVSFLLVWL